MYISTYVLETTIFYMMENMHWKNVLHHKAIKAGRAIII